MTKNKTLLLIAGVAIMLAGATSAYGYLERWEGWFNSGYLICLDSRFDYTTGSGTLEDMTDGSDDYFFVSSVTPSTFTCESGEYAGYYIMLWPDASGSKPTGQAVIRKSLMAPPGQARRFSIYPPTPQSPNRLLSSPSKAPGIQRTITITLTITLLHPPIAQTGITAAAVLRASLQEDTAAVKASCRRSKTLSFAGGALPLLA
jgi:hypothetical protein